MPQQCSTYNHATTLRTDAVLVCERNVSLGVPQRPATSQPAQHNWRAPHTASSFDCKTRPHMVQSAAEPADASRLWLTRGAQRPPSRPAVSNQAARGPTPCANALFGVSPSAPLSSFAERVQEKRPETALAAGTCANNVFDGQRTATAPSEMMRSGTMARRRQRESRAIRDAAISASAWGADPSLPVYELFDWHMQVRCDSTLIRVDAPAPSESTTASSERSTEKHALCDMHNG